MVDSQLKPILEKVTISNPKESGQQKEKKQAEQVEARIKNLLQQRGSIDTSEAMALRNEAAGLDRLADYSEKIADLLEQDSKNLKKEKLEDIKETLMAQLGVPAEFIEQLAILVKAGPDALREAAVVYREEAKKRRENADIAAQHLANLDKEIKELSHIQKEYKLQDASDHNSIKNFLAELRYKESLRDRSELILKEMLEQIEE